MLKMDSYTSFYQMFSNASISKGYNNYYFTEFRLSIYLFQNKTQESNSRDSIALFD